MITPLRRHYFDADYVLMPLRCRAVAATLPDA